MSCCSDVPTYRHAGLTALCLKHMHERLGRGHRAVSFNDWLVYADITLPRTLTAWKTMQKMVDSLTGEIPSFNDERKADAAAARRLLSQRFLQSSEAITLGDPKEVCLSVQSKYDSHSLCVTRSGSFGGIYDCGGCADVN